MSLRLLVRDHPQRAIAIRTDSHALIFRHSHSSTKVDDASHVSLKSTSPKCMVEFSNLSAIDLTPFRNLHVSGIHGTLGLININAEVYLCVISAAVTVAKVRPGETVQRIQSVEFFCLSKSDYDYELHNGNGYSADHEVHDGQDNNYDLDSRDASFEHPCIELKKILNSGTFYYSVNFDLTNRLQNRVSKGSTFEIDTLNEDFLWNSYMIDPLIKFRSRLAAHERRTLDEARILTSTIRGFALTITVPAASSPIKAIQSNLPSNLTLISRLSCRRAGTRFNARGIDDDGFVANFVESETVYCHPSGPCFSYVQIRGSVPIFWEQATGLLPGQQKIQITRSPEATQPAFDKHFERLEMNYGVIHILNLLSASKAGEAELTTRYKHHVIQSPANRFIEFDVMEGQRMLQQSHFDFHAETKGPSGYEAASAVRRLISKPAESFVYFLCNDAQIGDIPQSSDDGRLTKGPMVILQQEGVFRTNCLDCLDRTNLIQTILSQMAMESFLSHRSEHASADFWMRHSSVWADSGDALSKIYAGTGALKSSFTRHGKMSLAGAIADARKSATRMYINNFADKGRQNTIDMLLGRLIEQSPVHLYDPITDFVNAELKKRIHEYSTVENVQIWVGTFNLNGQGGGMRENLAAWLCPEINRSQQLPEIVAVGFQEIVELSPQQIMSTDPVRRQAWEQVVRQTLNDNARKQGSEEYVLVRSGQLVGAALMIFVKSGVLSRIKNVEGSVKKTGLSGMAGNKGAVAIRMDYASTRLCFVTAHLAAGFANYEERNRDYRTISEGLRFQRNRSIEDHDTIIWLGDFNYRIGLSDEKVRRLIQVGDLETLYQNDQNQLNLQMVAGQAFPFYSEAKITFMPTYKYKNGTDSYDNSEKARIPAWCDRILRKGDNLRQINYNTAPLRFSDHRPVFATFQCAVCNIDEQLKDNLSHEIYAQRRLAVGKVTAAAPDEEIDDEDLIGYESIAPELPPASSDRGKWWLHNGLPAQSTLKPPSSGSIPNPSRPSNPFTRTGEADWVVVPKHSSRPPVISRNDSAANVSEMEKTGRRTPRYDVNIRPPSSSLDKPNDSTFDRVQVNQGQYPRPPPPSAPNVVRKPAPPVPRKPSSLTGTDERRRNSGEAPLSRSLTSNNPVPRVSGTRLSKSPRRSTSTLTDVGKANQSPSSYPDGPPLPPRQSPPAQPVPPSGLLDEEDDGARMIPSLQPIRRY